MLGEKLNKGVRQITSELWFPWQQIALIVLLPLWESVIVLCNCSMFCCTLLYVHSSIAIILMGKRELVALLNLSS